MGYISKFYAFFYEILHESFIDNVDHFTISILVKHKLLVYYIKMQAPRLHLLTPLHSTLNLRLIG